MRIPERQDAGIQYFATDRKLIALGGHVRLKRDSLRQELGQPHVHADVTVVQYPELHPRAHGLHGNDVLVGQAIVTQEPGIWSHPTPKCRSASSRTTSAEIGIRRLTPSSTTKSFPRDCIFVKSSCIDGQSRAFGEWNGDGSVGGIRVFSPHHG